jgi:tRNA pseudouridine55 synthase
MKDGILFIDKEKGLTSRYVDNRIQKLFQTDKVGHLGTLDPFATGLLVVAVGKATKYLPYLDDSRKSYLASLRLGESSSTGDPDGVITKFPNPAPEPSPENISAVLSSFVGKGVQIPPMTSAIKIGGTPLYKLARAGETIERKPRQIEIFEIHLLQVLPNSVDFSCTVSKGTYIRSLGEDIAAKLGTCGYLTALRRVSIGDWGLMKAKTLEIIGEGDLMEPTMMMGGFQRVELTPAENKKAHDGVPLVLLGHEEERVFLTFQEIGVAVYKKGEDGLYRSERGLF